MTSSIESGLILVVGKPRSSQSVLEMKGNNTSLLSLQNQLLAHRYLLSFAFRQSRCRLAIQWGSYQGVSGRCGAKDNDSSCELPGRSDEYVPNGPSVAKL